MYSPKSSPIVTHCLIPLLMNNIVSPGLDPFESLNPEQSLAVGHGLGDDSGDTRPLLIIAGAGSGKTNTLAYRVACCY